MAQLINALGTKIYALSWRVPGLARTLRLDILVSWHTCNQQSRDSQLEYGGMRCAQNRLLGRALCIIYGMRSITLAARCAQYVAAIHLCVRYTVLDHVACR